MRIIHVAKEIVDEFEGWLEFAGRDVPGVPWCSDWPRTFTIERMTKFWPNDRCGRRVITDCTSYVVRSPDWPAEENRCWEPILIRREEV